MAQYLPYIPEVLPEVPLYKPDFSFFDRMMQRKEFMYEQGVAQARTAYHSVLDAPLSDQANIPLRDQYVKDAREQLRKISSSDLSLQKNIDAAESIFSPFWNDKFIMQDAAATKWYQGQASILDGWKNSSDPKVRENYNGISEMYLMNGLEKLRNAGRNPQAYASLEKRKAVPFRNIEAYLQEQAGKNDLTIKYDDPNGIYMIKNTNGERTKDNFATWAQGMMGNNFYEQFRVTGVVEKEERLKGLKKAFPNLSEAELNNMLSETVVSELSDGYSRRTNEVKVELAKIDSSLTQLAKSDSPQNELIVQELVNQRRVLLSRQSGIDVEYDVFSKKENKDKIREAVMYNPDGYFATLAKQRLVNNWATAKASIGSKEVVENTAFTNAQNREMTRQRDLVTQQKNIWDHEQELWERVNGKTGTKTGKTKIVKDVNGNEVEVPEEGIDKENALVYSGFSGIDITRNAATALDLFNTLQSKGFNESFGLIFDQRGILSLAKKIGLSEEEVSHVATAMKNELADNEYKFTPEQNQAVSKLEKALQEDANVKAAGIKIKGPDGLRNALIYYAAGYFKNKNELNLQGGNAVLDPDEYEAIIRYLAAVKKLETYNANETRREELIKKNIIGDTKNGFNKLVVDRNGKKDMVSISDVQHLFKDATFDGPDGNPVKFSAKQIAKAYFDGSITKYVPTGMATFANSQQAQGGNITYGYTITIDKNKYNLLGTVNAFGNLVGEAGNQVPESLVKLDKGIKQLDQQYYGSSQEFASKFKAAQQSVVPDLLMFKDESGKQGTAWTMFFNSKKSALEGDKAAQIMDQALNMSNGDILDDKGVPLNTEMLAGIRAFLGNEDQMEKVIKATYIPQGVDGKRTIRITFTNTVAEDSKTKIGNVSLQDLSGKQFDIVLNDGVTAPAIDALPNSTGYQVYDVITRGKVFKSDPVIEASGFKFTITPNLISSENSPLKFKPEYVTIDLKYMERVNTKTADGKMVTQLKEQNAPVKINLVGENAKSPDEIVNKLYQLYQEVILKNKMAQEEYENYNKTTKSGTSFNTKEFLQQQGLGHLTK